MGITIYYHGADFDGICSAAIAYRELKNHQPTLIGVDYSDTFDTFEHIKENEDVYILDFSFKPDVMEKLLAKTKNVIWIDHHKSAIDNYKYSMQLQGLREVGKAGCELAWKWFHGNKETPELITILGRYDVWDFTKYDYDYLRSYQAGLKTCIGWEDPRSDLWRSILFRVPTDISNRGLIALKYQQSENTNFCKKHLYPTFFEGYKAICGNSLSNPNVLMESLDLSSYDLFVTFVFNGSTWDISLRTHQNNDIDVSEIAKKYGGGGHKKAAGFHVAKLPEELLKRGEKE
jgi:oligoribonuclease NrnB/cAMP/cGMP phosphodiesterase (DHH superfamily)